MDDILAISKIVKRYIKMRGYSIQQVADKLNINYKTFDGILNRDAIDAKLLFKLANLLDIDLCWMSQLYNKGRTISFLDQYQLSRMNSEMRKAELNIVLPCLDRHIIENPCSINDVKNCLLKDFNQLFYLLDVLLPENYNIRITVEREHEKYYCVDGNSTGILSNTVNRRLTASQFFEGHEMLKFIIINRKAELKL